MFGQNTQNVSAGTAPAVQDSTETIFDVSAADFEARVMAASMEKPVIVDFWAPWCGPCKQLMPVLENAVKAAGGEVLMAKVNLDENPELGQALRVQSVPTVFGFLGGQPVDAFQGAQPESEIKAFVDKLLAAARANKPGAIDIPDAMKAASEALAENDLQTAQGIYAQILQQEEAHAGAYVGMIRIYIKAGALEQAAGLIEQAPEGILKEAEFEAAKTALEMAQKAGDIDISALEKNAIDKPDDQQAHIDLAQGQFAIGQKEQAMETLLGLIAKDREWNEQLARKTLLKFFEALGHADPLTLQGRKKLSALLFS